MFDIKFYEDEHGYSDVKAFIKELRESDRILYAYVKDNTFVLLHHFQKKTQKTPAAEIEKAKRELEDYKRRYE